MLAKAVATAEMFLGQFPQSGVISGNSQLLDSRQVLNPRDKQNWNNPGKRTEVHMEGRQEGFELQLPQPMLLQRVLGDNL